VADFAGALGDVAYAQGSAAHLDRSIHPLQQQRQNTPSLQYRARQLADGMALALQGALLVQHAPAYVADAFCAGRLAERSGLNTGTLPTGLDCAAIIARA